MFKRLLAGVCAAFFILPQLPLGAVGAEGDWVRADILLVYNSSPSPKEHADIESIVKTLTYLQRSVVFAAVDEGAPPSQYGAVICYNLRGDLGGFASELANAGRAVMIMGGDFAPAYAEQIGRRISHSPVRHEMATVEYEFSDGERVTGLFPLTDTTLLYGEADYLRGSVAAMGLSTALYTRFGDFIYTPVSDLSSPLVRAAFAKETAQWLWPYSGSPHSFGQYIVLDNIYPFVEPKRLMEAVKMLVDEAQPFVICVMPIYQNGDYPAFKRFCEILRYAQANGGAIIMHVPIMRQDADNVNKIREYLTIATHAYASFGVYPLGIKAPESFMFSEVGREILRRYSTVFFYEDSGAVTLNLEDRSNLIYRDGHIVVSPAVKATEEGGSVTDVFLTALSLNLYDGIEKIREQVRSAKLSEVAVRNLWDIDATVYADNFALSVSRGYAYLNGEKVSLTYEPFSYDENFNYQNNVLTWVMRDLKSLNKALLFIVVTAGALFILFIIRGRRLIRNKFLYPKKEEGVAK